MHLVQHNNKYIVYDDHGRVVIICTNKRIAMNYAKEQSNAS